MTQFRILNSHPRGDTIDAGTVFPDRNSELRIEHWFNPRPDFHPTVRTEAAPRLRAVLMEAEAIRQSSVFSARMATSRCGEIKELLATILLQAAVSLSSFCTIRIL